MALGWKANGFTPAKKGICLEALARGASVAEACREAVVSPTTFYKHEKKDPEFASLCRAARARSGGMTSLETLAWERGVTGVEEEVVQGGKVVGTKRKRSDAVFKMLLEGGASGRYGPQIKALREQIEKELRPKIEAELRAEIRRQQHEDGPRLIKELEEMLSDFNRRMGGNG
ncbi:MAG TPA: hypothetical protein VFP12_08790 [Allosphingosinicella sp.]|nr:hypothetical protein [Allosphingosinicella sp.]